MAGVVAEAGLARVAGNLAVQHTSQVIEHAQGDHHLAGEGTGVVPARFYTLDLPPGHGAGIDDDGR